MMYQYDAHMLGSCLKGSRKLGSGSGSWGTSGGEDAEDIGDAASTAPSGEGSSMAASVDAPAQNIS